MALVLAISSLSTNAVAFSKGCNEASRSIHLQTELSSLDLTMGDLDDQGHIDHQDEDHHHLPSSAESEHECPQHQCHCLHHSFFLLSSSSKDVGIDNYSVQNFVEFASPLKPAPILEGPFQPPRA